jgi:formiminoglutamase
MTELFERLTPADVSLFHSGTDVNDPRMGQIVSRRREDYDTADIIILGNPQDEGVRRSGGRAGAAAGPAAIRAQFYRLTTFNVRRRIVDIGDVEFGASLEETHENHRSILTQLLNDKKRVIVLGGGNDISYPTGCAMAEVFGPECWIGVNIDSHLDVRIAEERNSGTQYRQLIEEGHLLPTYFYEVGFQSHFCSPAYYEYVRSMGVHRISLELLRSRAEADIELKEQIRENFIGHSSSLNTFFGFDMDSVRMSDAPGTSAPSPLGLKASEFIQLVKYAASLANTKVIEFTEVNPEYDIDDRTARLVAIGMHRFCTGVS